MGYRLREGNYEKFGVYKQKDAVIFTFEGEKEDNCAILLYRENGVLEERIEVPEAYCRGAVRSVGVVGLPTKHLKYNYEINGKVFTDLYARKIIGREKWNDRARVSLDYAVCGGYEAEEFVWGDDFMPEVPRYKMVMYKLHVRGFSMDSGVRGKAKGTFRAVKAALLRLKALGVTTIEFMPVYEFEEIVIPKKEKLPDYIISHIKKVTTEEEKEEQPEEKVNYWGYVPGNYFAVKSSYSSTSNASKEWKELIQEIHKCGMECVMEMYFDEQISQTFIIDVLRFWVNRYHVDGFHMLGTSVPITAVENDPILRRTKLFYTSFEPHLLEQKRNYPHIFLYNDEYLYPARKLLSHIDGNLEEFLCQQRKQHDVQGFVNYITNNNGFTLLDLFSYSEKHNEANGEGNHDGLTWNYSSNCGIEGRTTRRYVNEVRERRMKNAIAVLMTAQGVPMILSGDEAGNSQDGNNNAYCQDNRIGWVNWKKAAKYGWLSDFISKIAQFRQQHPVLAMEKPVAFSDYNRKGFPDLSYHGDNAWISYLSGDRLSVGVMYCGAYAQREDGTPDQDIYVGYNFHTGIVKLALPRFTGKNKKWYLVMDTSQKEPFLCEQEAITGTHVSLDGPSVVILAAKEETAPSEEESEKGQSERKHEGLGTF